MRKPAILYLTVISSIFNLVFFSAANADVPGKVNYQGKLTDIQGELIDGQNSMSFTLFTQSTGGGIVWSENHSNVQITNGLFNVMLGTGNDMTDAFQENDLLYLEIGVAGETLSPRQEMVSVGYAMTAGKSPGDNPVGTVQMYAGSTAPPGWLLCDGAEVSRTTYEDLYTVIGTNYGSGDGVTTFNVPDLRGNIPVGLKSSDSDFDTLGKIGGEKTHTLIISEMPSHSHTVDPPSADTTTAGDHYHSVNPPNTLSGGGGAHSHNITLRITHSDGSQVTGEILNTGIFWGTGRDRYNDTADWVGDHQHWLDIGQFNSGYSGNHSHTVEIGQFNSGNTGDGQAHNNVQPYQVMNYIIKY